MTSALIVALCSSNFVYDLDMPRKFQEDMLAKRIMCVELAETCAEEMRGLSGDTFKPCMRRAIKKAKEHNPGLKT